MGLFTRTPKDPRSLFLDQVLSLAKTRRLLDNARADPAQFAITGTTDGHERTLYLENLFVETRDVPPDERTQRIVNFLTASSEADDVPSNFAEARERLLPVIRAATYFDILDGTEKPRPIRRGFAPFLIEGVVLDGERAMHFINEENVKGWGVALDQVFDVARANLSAGADVGIEVYADAPSTIWHVASEDTYESSRLLLPGWLAAFAGRVRGRPIAAVPHRSMLLVAGDEDPATIERVLASAKAEFGASPRRLSPAPYTVDDAGRVVPLELPPAHPVRDAVRTAHLTLAVHEYGIQKEHLEKQHERDGTDIFIGTYTAIDLPAVGLVSYCVWSEGVDSLLPQTDLVALYREGEKHFMVGWKEVARLAGAFWAPAAGMDPPMMRTLGWPDDQALEELRRAAVET